ncbi:group II truncated hemoglobin [Sphingomonas sp.]|uniref:group II truncated hemoglobin n=1 Tax=Sphingomonas sp. TaxID=28214 RepID=UPI003B3BC451
MNAPPPDGPTPFERIGGDTRVRALADRFYDLMESDPRYSRLRAMHGEDLAPMRHALAGFLTGWLGGPRDWFQTGRCIMSAHRGMAVTPATAGAWLHAMGRAMADTDVPPPVANQMRHAFARMAAAMIVAE